MWIFGVSIANVTIAYFNRTHCQKLTCKFHELVEVLDGEDWLPELPQVELQHARHGVDVVTVRHVRQRVLAALERLAEIIYLGL